MNIIRKIIPFFFVCAVVRFFILANDIIYSTYFFYIVYYVCSFLVYSWLVFKNDFERSAMGLFAVISTAFITMYSLMIINDIVNYSAAVNVETQSIYIDDLDKRSQRKSSINSNVYFFFVPKKLY